MKRTILLCIFVASFVAVKINIHAGDTIKRDANGNVIEREQSTATGVIVRDPNGNVTGRKEIHQNGDGSKTIIVRDANGNIVERDTVR